MEQLPGLPERFPASRLRRSRLPGGPGAAGLHLAGLNGHVLLHSLCDARIPQALGSSLDGKASFSPEHVLQALAFQELHGEVQPAIGSPPKVEDLDNMLIIDGTDRGCFPAKALNGQVVPGQLVVRYDQDVAALHDRFVETLWGAESTERVETFERQLARALTTVAEICTEVPALTVRARPLEDALEGVATVWRSL